jgi:hypothetical protein
MQYQLRLFENDVEVSTSTVAIVPGANNHPAIGQVIGDVWRVVGFISYSEDEHCLRVERVQLR